MLSKKYGNRNWKSKMRPNKNYGHKKRLNGGNESKQQERFSITTFHHAIHQTLSSRFSVALTASRKSIVYRDVPSLAPFSPWMQMAKSFNGEELRPFKQSTLSYLRHFALLNGGHTCLLQCLREFDQWLVAVQFATMLQSPGPCKNGSNRIC